MGTMPSLSAKPMSLSGVREPTSAAPALPAVAIAMHVVTRSEATESLANLRAAPIAGTNAVALRIIFVPSSFLPGNRDIESAGQ